MLAYKTTYHWHLTPHRLHKVNSGVSDMYWKGCGLLGTYYHCFWACPRLLTFWTQVILQVGLISDLAIPLDPGLVILNVWRSLKTGPLRWELVELLFCAAHHVIAMFWKTPKVPTLKDWYFKIWDYFLQDKISVSVQD